MIAPSPRVSFRERMGIKKPPPPPPLVVSNELALLGLPPDSWIWDVAGPIANTLGVTSGGVAAGSLAAKAVAAAAASASSAGSASAIAATLATPVGLCVVTTCAVVGGGVLLGRALFFDGTAKVSDDAWIVVESNAAKKKEKEKQKEKEATDQFAVAVFEDEKTARKAFKHSRVRSKALFGPRKALVESRGWQDKFRKVVGAM